MGMRHSHNAVWVAFFVFLIDQVAFGILLPLIPALFLSAESDYLLTEGHSLNIQLFIAGAAVSVYPILQFVMSPIVGAVSDRVGRKRIVTTLTLMSGVSHLLTGAAIVMGSLWLFVGARVIAGIASSKSPIIRAVIADVTTSATRARYLGLTTAATGGGYIAGSLLIIVSSLVSIEPSTLFFIIGLLVILSTYVVWQYLPETWQPVTTLKKIRVWQCLYNVRAAYTDEKLWRWYGVMFIFSLCAGVYTYFVGTFLTEQYYFSQAMIGVFFSCVGMTLLVSQLVLLPWLTQRYAEIQVLR